MLLSGTAVTSTAFFNYGFYPCLFIIFILRVIMENFASILSMFLHDADQYQVFPISQGLINRTYKVTDGENKEVYVLQQLNTKVFVSPEIIAQNADRASKLIKSKDPVYKCLQFLKTRTGQDYHIDAKGEYWRMSFYLSHADNIQKIATPGNAYQTAFEFGRFTQLLNDNEPEQFIASIPRFHDLSLRFQQFEESLSLASHQRKDVSSSLIDFLMEQKPLLDTYHHIVSNNSIPLRVQHGDTKISNILFDEIDQRPICVIDWDTLMPGYFISDLGDMIRTMVCAAD